MSNSLTVDNLNKALQMEMSAAHQYQLHAHVLNDWGLNILAEKMRAEQAEEITRSMKEQEAGSRSPVSDKGLTKPGYAQSTFRDSAPPGTSRRQARRDRRQKGQVS